jgi:hypothetical protein
MNYIMDFVDERPDEIHASEYDYIDNVALRDDDTSPTESIDKERSIW